MNARTITLSTMLCSASLALAQFPPPAGQPGTTAVHADSSAFVAWATGCTVTRGPMDITAPDAGLASVGEESMATGAAGGNGVISLGDGGVAVLTFQEPITDGPGWDFAVFENSFSDDFLELAFVEVSSNGTDYYRFPATSLTQTDVQVGSFGAVDATQIDNLAGTYRAQYGTPFDLAELEGLEALDIQAITHVRIVDVVGNIDETYASVDQHGNVVNDPWPTAFASSGFDLDAVGVINRLSVGVAEAPATALSLSLAPNPASRSTYMNIHAVAAQRMVLTILDAAGRVALASQQVVLVAGMNRVELDVADLQPGIYFAHISTAGHQHTRQLVIDHGY